jgi:hypothetical protein
MQVSTEQKAGVRIPAGAFQGVEPLARATRSALRSCDHRNVRADEYQRAAKNLRDFLAVFERLIQVVEPVPGYGSFTRYWPTPDRRSESERLLKSFEVPQSYADSLFARAVPQRGGAGAPIQQVDITRTDRSLGLVSSEFADLACAIIPGSGRC